MFKKISSYIFLSLVISSCALSGGSKDDGVVKYITGATKVGAVKDVHLVNIVRAIGVPSNTLVIGRYKYYQWEYSRMVGVSTIFAGGSTTFYCKLSVEARNNKIKLINWYGNQCAIFLDQINDYFKNKLNIEVISEEDSKQQVIVTKSEELAEEKARAEKEEKSKAEEKAKAEKEEKAKAESNPIEEAEAEEEKKPEIRIVSEEKQSAAIASSTPDSKTKNTASEKPAEDVKVAKAVEKSSN